MSEKLTSKNQQEFQYYYTLHIIHLLIYVFFYYHLIRF